MARIRMRAEEPERSAPRVCVVPAVGHKGFYCLRLFLSVRIVRERREAAVVRGIPRAADAPRRRSEESAPAPPPRPSS